jgi:hypothetical protein
LRGCPELGEKRLTGAVFLAVVKAYNSIEVDSLIYKITVLDFPPYPVKLISSYLFSWMFAANF